MYVTIKTAIATSLFIASIDVVLWVDIVVY